MRPQTLLYAALNPPVRALLRSPIHALASRSLAILNYRGRKSGRAFSTPLSFVRDGALVRLLSSHNTTWWKNFRAGPTPVEIEIARKTFTGTARLFDSDSEMLRGGVRAFLTALPRDAGIYGIGLDKDRKPRESEIEKAAHHVILVEIELDTAEG
jgi:deazaflavin-dependent oxidoreductase (nitroreductase family)